MEQAITARVYVLGDDVDTDQIIPARHLAISLDDAAERARYGGLALSGVPLEKAGLPGGNRPFSDTISSRSPYAIIVAGKNFGCGSSREHAPVALAEAGLRAVVARSYARIFYRNAIDGGYFPPLESEEDLTGWFATGDEAVLDLGAAALRNITKNRECALREPGAAGEIIRAGGLFEYARGRGLVEKRR
ncbi:MAG: 3-isopropylmalate dehydratase [Acidobacteria bacterium]|nr:3-isopropylmalate dehydratase [Acidobacteriota bacterium]